MTEIILKPAPSVVRLIRKGDEVAVFDAIILAHGDNGIFPVSAKKVIALIDAAVSEDSTSGYKPIVGIIEGVKGIEALTILTLDQMPYSDTWFLSELINFVHPDYRKSKHVHALMDFQMQFAQKMSKTIGTNVALITGIITRKRLEPKMRLFQRKYMQIGALFVYNLGKDTPDDLFNQRRVENLRPPAPVVEVKKKSGGRYG